MGNGGASSQSARIVAQHELSKTSVSDAPILRQLLLKHPTNFARLVTIFDDRPEVKIYRLVVSNRCAFLAGIFFLSLFVHTGHSPPYSVRRYPRFVLHWWLHQNQFV